MQIVELAETENDNNQGNSWKRFIKNNESLIIHTPEFRSLVEKSFSCKSHYLAAIENQEIKAIFPFFHINHKIFGKKVISVPFLEYGGPCGESRYIPDMLNYIYGKYLNVDYIEVRQGIENKDFDTVLGKLMKKNTEYKRFVLKLDKEEIIWKNLDKQKRKAIKNAAEHGIVVKDISEKEMPEFYKLYLKNMRAFGSPPYSKRFFSNFFKHMVNNGLGKVIGAYYNQKLISALVGYCYKERIHIIISVSDDKFLSYRPNEAVHWHFIKYAIANNYKYFDFGRVREGSGQFRFKKEWGCELKDLNHYYLLIKAKQIPHIDPDNIRYKLIIKIWKRLPIKATKVLGPWLRKGLGI